MKTFPLQFELAKQVGFYPQEPADFSGDVLEIGPGLGDLLIAMAAREPAKKFVAIELDKNRFHRLMTRIEKNRLNNILLIQGNARLILPRYFAGENTFERLIILFPDPWPKDRHAFHRLLSLETLWYFWFLLRSAGLLYLATDDEKYFSEIHSALAQIGGLKNTLSPHDSVQVMPELGATYFQKKWLAEGKVLHFMRYVKIS